MHVVSGSFGLHLLADMAQVALKTVIDTFGMYAVEASLLGHLAIVFNPEMVHGLDDATITKIASESVDSIANREGLEKQLSTLKDCLETLQTLQRAKIRRISGMSGSPSLTILLTAVTLKELTNCQTQLRSNPLPLKGEAVLPL